MSDFEGSFEYEALEPTVEAMVMTVNVDLELLAQALERHAREIRETFSVEDEDL